MLMFIAEDDTETDTQSSIHSKKLLPIKSTIIKITSNREKLQLDANGLYFFWC